MSVAATGAQPPWRHAAHSRRPARSTRASRPRHADPTPGYTDELASLTNDGLVAFRRVGGRRRARWCPISPCRCRRRPTVAAPTPSSCARASAIRRAPPCTPPTSAAAGARRRGRDAGLAPFYAAIGGARPASGGGGVRPLPRDPGRRRRRHDHLPADRSRRGLPRQAGAAHRRRRAPGVGISQRARCPATGPYMVAGLQAPGRCGSCATRASTCGRKRGEARRLRRRDHHPARRSSRTRGLRAVERGTGGLRVRGGAKRRGQKNDEELLHPLRGSDPQQPAARDSSRPSSTRGPRRSTTSTRGGPSTTRSTAAPRPASRLAPARAAPTCQILPPELPRIPALLPLHRRLRAGAGLEAPDLGAGPAPDRPLEHTRHARKGVGSHCRARQRGRLPRALARQAWLSRVAETDPRCQVLPVYATPAIAHKWERSFSERTTRLPATCCRASSAATRSLRMIQTTATGRSSATRAPID